MEVMCILLMNLLDIKGFGKKMRTAGIAVLWGKKEKFYL
jgi:hypothetical protein